MTTPEPPGRRSPLRVAGLALVGVGVVAAIIGLAVLAGLGGGNGGQTAAPPPGSADPAQPSGAPIPGAPAPGGPQPGEPQPGQPQPNDGAVPVPSFPAPSPGAPLPPGVFGDGSGTGTDGGTGFGPGGDAGAGADGTGIDGTGTGGSGGAGSLGADGKPYGTGAARAPVRVYNNSTISGLATTAAADFRNAGWTVEEVANYPSGIIPTSTAYYTAGTGEQQAAQNLGAAFGLRVEPRFSGLSNATPGLIVIVTNDYKA